MGDRLQEIRTVWNYQDLTQPISLGRAFEDVEWCLGEIERLTKYRQPNEDYNALLFEISDLKAERDAALKREGRLRDHIADALDLLGMGTETGATEVLKAALADEGRE